MGVTTSRARSPFFATRFAYAHFRHAENKTTGTKDTRMDVLFLPCPWHKISAEINARVNDVSRLQETPDPVCVRTCFPIELNNKCGQYGWHTTTVGGNPIHGVARKRIGATRTIDSRGMILISISVSFFIYFIKHNRLRCRAHRPVLCTSVLNFIRSYRFRAQTSIAWVVYTSLYEFL